MLPAKGKCQDEYAFCLKSLPLFEFYSFFAKASAMENLQWEKTLQ